MLQVRQGVEVEGRSARNGIASPTITPAIVAWTPDFRTQTHKKMPASM